MTRLEELTKSLRKAHAKEMWTHQRKAFAAHILASDYRTNLTFNEWLAGNPELAGPDFETWLVGEAICGNGEADELMGLRQSIQVEAELHRRMAACNFSPFARFKNTGIMDFSIIERKDRERQARPAAEKYHAALKAIIAITHPDSMTHQIAVEALKGETK